MKLTAILLACVLGLCACGPSDQEKRDHTLKVFVYCLRHMQDDPQFCDPRP